MIRSPLISHTFWLQVADINKDSLAREEQLQSLLREKDVEMRNLHHSLSSQITTKNQGGLNS